MWNPKGSVRTKAQLYHPSTNWFSRVKCCLGHSGNMKKRLGQEALISVGNLPLRVNATRRKRKEPECAAHFFFFLTAMESLTEGIWGRLQLLQFIEVGKTWLVKVGQPSGSMGLRCLVTSGKQTGSGKIVWEPSMAGSRHRYHFPAPAPRKIFPARAQLWKVQQPPPNSASWWGPSIPTRAFGGHLIFTPQLVGIDSRGIIHSGQSKRPLWGGDS